MYNSKKQDHEKRKNQEGSYSVYNYMYHYLLDNFEPSQLEASIACESAERKLVDIGKEYCIKGGNKINEQELVQHARQAITNFCNNDGQHGDTGDNLGKRYDNSFNTIKQSLSDLRW